MSNVWQVNTHYSAATAIACESTFKCAIKVNIIVQVLMPPHTRLLIRW